MSVLALASAIVRSSISKAGSASRVSLVSAGLAGLVISLAVSSPASAAVSPVVDRTTSTVTASPLPTVQINGIAWAQAVVGNTVFAGGSFTSARPAGVAAGTSETPRNNLLAYDITTGALNTAFNPNLNAQVKAMTLSPDKTRLYVGGDFTAVGSTSVGRIAAFDTSTGALIGSFAASVNGTVTGIAATNSTVYVAGTFNTAGPSAISRQRLAAFSAGTGSLLSWAPTLDNNPSALVLTPDNTKVVVAGNFQHVNGVAAQGISAVSASTGATRSWPVNQVIHNGDASAGIYSLSVDNDTVYGTSWNLGSGNFEGLFATSVTGQIKWLADCHGDTYTSFSAANGVVYGAGHTHNCSNIGGFPEHSPRWAWRATAYTKAATGTVLTNSQNGSGYGNFAGRPSPSMVYWFPEFGAGTVTGLDQAVWTMSGNANYLVTGGEFPTINGKPQQGLARFAIPAAGGVTSKPTQLGGVTNPTVQVTPSKTVNLSWLANWDRDDRALTYKVVRSDLGDANPLNTQTVSSTFWQRPTISYTDTTVQSGVTYKYRILESDNNNPAGSTQSDYVSVTIP